MFSAELGDSAAAVSLRVGFDKGEWKPSFGVVEFQNVAARYGQRTVVKTISSGDRPAGSGSLNQPRTSTEGYRKGNHSASSE